MGKAHSYAYQKLPMFFGTRSIPVKKVICGRTETRIVEAAKTFGWEEYETSWRKVVEREDIDLIDIITPNVIHKDIAVEAAKVGEPIICDKPPATNFADGKKMLKAVKSAEVKHMTGFNYCKVPAVSLAKTMIEEEQLGRIYHFRAVYLQDEHVDPGLPIEWRLTKELAGSGVLGNIGSHIIDIGRFLVGDFAKAVGMQEIFIRKRPISRGASEMQEVDVDDATLF